MQAADLINYIKNPQLLTRQSIAELQKLVEDFPYFQSAHMLLSIASKKWDASVYQQQLKKTAIVVSNRAHLFALMYQLENEAPVETASKATVITEPTVEEKNTAAEESSQELDILKATELATQENKVEEPAGDKEAAEKIKTAASEKPVLTPEESLEKEIEKQVVNAFVEKEILKTPELHRPKPKQDAESFVEWLSLLKKNNGQTYQQIEEQVNAEKLRQQAPKPAEPKLKPRESQVNQNKKEKNRALIDKIIENNPGLIRSKEEQKFFTADNKAKESLLENEHLVTETLAKIYALQGSVNKAVRAYEILSLKFPQKSAYFATLIQKLKNNQ